MAIADIAYEAYGKDLNELFENAAFVIFELSANLNTVESKKKLEISLEKDTLENLLYDFLSEILFLKDARYIVFKEIKVSIKKVEGQNPYKLNAVLKGDSINPEKQQLENDIKAVTMHMFQIKKEGKGYKATVVLDI